MPEPLGMDAGLLLGDALGLDFFLAIGCSWVRDNGEEDQNL